MSLLVRVWSRDSNAVSAVSKPSLTDSASFKIGLNNEDLFLEKSFHPLVVFREEMYLASCVTAWLILAPLDSTGDVVMTLGISTAPSLLLLCGLNFNHMPPQEAGSAP